MFLAELHRDSVSRQAYMNLIALGSTGLKDMLKAYRYAEEAARRGIILPENVKTLLKNARGK